MVERPPAPPDAARLRFAGKLPEAWTLDGALDVWKGGACAEPGAKVRESTPRTCVDVALVSGRVILSGRVGIAATGGVWFSIGSSAEVLSPKQHTQFGDADITCTGELSPADRLACATTLAIEKKLERVYHVTEGSIDAADATGAMRPVDGAELSTKKTADGELTFEASIPLAALPRFVARGSAQVRGCAGVDRKRLDKGCDSTTLSTYAFDPRAAVHVSADCSREGVFSYFAFDSPDITICRRPALALECKDVPLFALKAENDAVRVGLAPTFRDDDSLAFVPAVELKSGGTIVQGFNEDYAEVQGIVKRATTIHVVKLQKKCEQNSCAAAYSLYRVGADGQLESVLAVGADERLFRTVTPFHDVGWNAFGLRGTSFDDGKPIEVRFTYDAASDGYEVKSR